MKKPTSAQLAWVSLGLFALGPVLAQVRLAEGLPGFAISMAGAALGALLVLWGLGLLIRRGTRPALQVLLPAVVAPAIVAISALGHGDHPRFNDYTTDATNPPRLGDGTPQQVEGLTGLTLDIAAGQARVWVVSALEARGAEVVSADDARVVAVERSAVFRFADDIAVRLTVDEDGQTRIDVRSRSRDGRSDLGVNARRIRALLDALAARAEGAL